MYHRQKILALIPARGGSKRVPNKNMKPLSGKPLIWYAITAALKSKLLDRVVVSTDSVTIAKAAVRYGADVPFLRPKALAGDRTPTIPVIKHALKYLTGKERYHADIIVLLQPTSPLVTAQDIDRAIKKLIATRAHACVSMCLAREKQEWIYAMNGDFLRQVQPRTRIQQARLYRLNGAIYVLSVRHFLKHPVLIDAKRTAAFLMPLERSVDIDYPVDFIAAESLLRHARENKNRY